MKHHRILAALLATLVVSILLANQCYAIDTANDISAKTNVTDLSHLIQYFHSNQSDYRSGKQIQFPECVTPDDCILRYGTLPPGTSYLCTDGLCVGTGQAEPPSCKEVGEESGRQLCEQLDGVLLDTPKALCLIAQCAHEYECILRRTGSPKQARAAYDACIAEINPRPDQEGTCLSIYISMAEIQVRRQSKFLDYLNCVSAIFLDCSGIKSELNNLDLLIDNLKSLRRFLGCSPDGE